VPVSVKQIEQLAVIDLSQRFYIEVDYTPGLENETEIRRALVNDVMRMPAYGRASNPLLQNVIRPLVDSVSKECAERNKKNMASYGPTMADSTTAGTVPSTGPVSLYDCNFTDSDTALLFNATNTTSAVTGTRNTIYYPATTATITVSSTATTAFTNLNFYANNVAIDNIEWYADPALTFGNNVVEDRKSRAKRRLARIKAMHLLEDHLAPEQKKDLRRYGFFKMYVRNEAGEEKVYRIHKGIAQNIDLVEEGKKGDKVIDTLCAHPDGVPEGDAMLVQKLMLETNEKDFLKIAKRWNPVRRNQNMLDQYREARRDNNRRIIAAANRELRAAA